MNPAIEELRKFAKGSITKSRLEKLQSALSRAAELSECLQPKSGDEEVVGDFEDIQSQLASALDELESACGDLELAEEKDEREDAQDEISSALNDVLEAFDKIMPLAVVGNAVVTNPDDARIIGECKAILALPLEQRRDRVLSWLESKPEEKEKKWQCMCKLIEKG